MRTPSRRFAVTAAAAAALALSATSAFGHATISPGTVAPGEQVTLTVQSIVERDALINEQVQIVVPRQWQTLSCAGPVLWTCTIDRKAVAPHVLVTYQPAVAATPADIDFSVTVKAPTKAVGSYLFRVLQTHADGWVEPWVYDTEPYPAPRVQVGGSTRTVNPERSKEDPRCFGPVRQPKDYASHDGTGGCAPAGAARTATAHGPVVPSLLTLAVA